MDDKILLALFDKFEKSSAAEMIYSGNGYSFELRRKEACFPNAVATVSAAPVRETTVSSPVSSSAQSRATAAVGTEQPHSSSDSASSGCEFIKSPIVGTFYRSPSPDAPAFVDVGKKVVKGQKLCIIEAMKMMNALEAEFDCEVVKILVENGDMVEFDQPILEVRRV